MATLKIYNLFTLGVFTSEKKNNVYVGLRLDVKTVEKFRALCKEERRNYNDQMELILEQWFAQRERQSDVVPDASGNATPGPQPFATPKHIRRSQDQRTGKHGEKGV